MSVTLKPNNMKYRDPDTGNYKGVDVIAERTTTEQIAEIRSAGTAQKNQIQQKGEQTLATIPSEYTQMYDDLNVVRDDLAPVYDATSTYAVGDLVTHDYQLYKCKTAIETAEAWTAAHWQIIDVDNLNKGIISEIDNVKAEINSSVTEVIPTTGSVISYPIPYHIREGISYLITIVADNNAALNRLVTRETSNGATIETVFYSAGECNNLLFTAEHDANYFAFMSSYGATVTISTLNATDAYILAKTNEQNSKTDLSLNNLFNPSGYYATNQGVGETASNDITPSNNVIGLKVPCDAGDTFSITGQGASAGRLWCLTDENLKILSVAPVSTTETNFELEANANGYLIVNVYKNDTFNIIKHKGQLKTTDLQKQITDLEADARVTGDKIADLKSDLSKVYEHNIDNQSLTMPLEGESATTLIYYPMKKGRYYLISITLTNQNMTAIITTRLEQTGGTLETAYSGLSAENQLFIPQYDGNYFVVTTRSEGAFSCHELTALTELAYTATNEKMSIKNINDAIMIDREYDESLVSGGIVTNVAVGTVIDYTRVASASISSVVIPCQSQDKLTLTGKGASAYRLWCFVDENDKLVNVANASITATDLELIAPLNGSYIINVYTDETHSIVKLNGQNGIDYLLEKTTDNTRDIETNTQAVDSLTDTVDRLNIIPTEEFDLSDHEMYDVSAYRAMVGYGTEPHAPYLEQFHELFDTLVTQYPNYVTRQDAAELAGLQYPAYANGISVAGDYEVTPAYKTYIYKFVDTNVGAGNLAYNQKKKLLITCGTHGNEIMAPFNAFIFASELCKGRYANYAKLRASYDVYIIPCLNGYGMYHSMRSNANWVDINRNFPTNPWVESGAETIGNKNSCVYTGSAAGSEFETQLVMAIYNLLRPGLHIDHHNYSGGDSQFYTNVIDNKFLRLTHQSLVDCSIAFVKNYPTYYGTSYLLVIPNREITYAPRMTEHNRNGKMVVWLSQQGCPFPCTIEIASDIRFLDGVNTQTYNDWAGSDTFSVAEYTLRNQVLRYGQYVLQLT